MMNEIINQLKTIRNLLILILILTFISAKVEVKLLRKQNEILIENSKEIKINNEKLDNKKKD